MGLDITAYETVTLLKACTVKEANEESARLDDGRDDVVLLYRHAMGNHDGMVDGYYETTGKSHRFRGGSYSGYNRWREQLAALVGTTPEAVWKDPKPGPFVELINFSDCEGFIGPKTAAKLAADFREWESKAMAVGVDDDWFKPRYSDWRKAFELASQGGAVKFH